MTPQQAKDLLRQIEGANESALQFLMDWKEVADALTAIAGMYCEYDYEVAFGDEWTAQGYSFVTLEDAQRRVAERRRRTPARIIRRLVTEWEVVE